MISSKNKPVNNQSKIRDFTTIQYRELLILAKKNYSFSSYDNINYNQNFILWRHDIDFSINRALKLAEIEHSEEINATYFINIHCDFYNAMEKAQSELIKKILGYGHHIGIHFDSGYYNIKNENELDKKIELESKIIKDIFDYRPTVFSFHNPNDFLLTCEKEDYGGLINCYSAKFKNEIPYISDSNGYWRFQRLKDALLNAEEKNLHVLTHPAWWQDKEEEPYFRIKRCVDGRANNTLANYEKQLDKDGRLNIGKKTSNRE